MAYARYDTNGNLISYDPLGLPPSELYQMQQPFIAPPIPTPTIAPLPPIAPIAPPQFDPLLSTQGLFNQGQAAITAAQAPLDVDKFIGPQLPLLRQGINEQLNINRATAQSDFMRRGVTGSSQEIQTLTRDLPEQANRALAEGTVKLLTAAYPLAQQEKAMIIDSQFKSASLSMQLRSMIGDEAFKTLDLNQRIVLANQDAQLKISLANTEMKFQAAIKQAEFAFTHAENEATREVARQELEYYKSERNKERQGAFLNGLMSLIGAGIAIGKGPEGMTGTELLTRGAVGGMLGQQGGNAFGNLFLLQN